MSELDSMVALVTGAASGIGAAVGRTLAARGAAVAGIDLHAAAMAEPVWGVEADVSDAAAVHDAVAAVAERFRGIDIVVNCAGIGAVGTVADTDDDEWRRVLDVNVIGTARVTREALPHLRQSPHPAVVNMCSITATVGLPDRAAYSASKGAVLSLTLAMAADHVREGIRINCVNPGTADTPWVARLLALAEDPEAERMALAARQPMGRLVTADEVAHAVAYLASPLSGSTTGTVLAVDGGMDSLRIRPLPS